MLHSLHQLFATLSGNTVVQARFSLPLDAQATFAKLFADIGREGDVRYAKLDDLLKGGLPPPSAVNSRHVQALRADLRTETLSHAAGLTSRSTIFVYGKSGFLGLHEAGHGRSTVGLTRARGPTLLITLRILMD